MATFDNTVRLRQLNQPELSGYITLVAGGIPSSTGVLTGVFYPYKTNPSGYITSGQTGTFITQSALDSNYYSTLSYVGSNYYPLSNPSGYVSSSNLVYVTGDQNISDVKNFTSVPTVNGSGVVLQGTAVLINTSQTVTGAKIFLGNFVNGNSNNLVATNSSGHAEGFYTTSIGVASHTEGYSTTAYGNYSHAEGNSTVATGESSHSEGVSTNAYGIGSHSEGYFTTASGNYQHVEGKYNIPSLTSLLIVGNGTAPNALSNILTVEPSSVNISGATNLSQRPFVNGTGVLLSGESSYNVSGDIWITNHTNGFSGNGSISSPYDGSTAQKLSGIFKAYEGKDVNINFFPGTYYTYPTYLHYNFLWKPGAWNIKGAGMDKTTIVVTGVTGAGRSCAFVNDFSSTNAEIKPMTVQDLTIDGGGYVSGACVAAVSIYNSNALISRVRATNCGTSDNVLECFPLQITPLYSSPQALKNNVIEDSIVINPWSGTSSMTAIIISQIENTNRSIYDSDVSGNANLSNIIRGCYVDLNSHRDNIYSLANDGPSNNFARQAFTAPMVENNYCQNVTQGVYQDTWNYNRNVFRNNSIINARFGIAINLSSSFSGDSALIENNIVELSNYTGYSYFIGIQFAGAETPSGRFKHVDISKNKIYVRSGNPYAFGDYIGINGYGGIQNLTITDNILPDFASLGLGAGSKTIYPVANQMRVYNNLSTGLSLLPEVNPPYVSATGNQTISGKKIFANDVSFSGSGIFSGGLYISGGLRLSPITNSGFFIISSNQFYVYTGSSNGTGVMPTINSCVGQTYFLKNRGAGTFTVSGSGSNQFYYTGVATGSIPMVDGQGFTVINDGTYWDVISKLI